MPAMLMLDTLDSARYRYLQELSEPRDNSLRLLVQEAVVNREGIIKSHPALPELNAILTEVSPIEATADCRVFELSWRHYVAYLVTEEMVGSCGSYKDEQFSGKLFRVYTKSHFLDHLARDTGGHTEVIRHYKLTCLNHLIDVAAYQPPELRLVSHGASASNRIQ